MGVESKTEYLIVDTSAFIKNASLQDIGQKIITTSSVVNEIKNKRQLKRLVVLPYDLEVKDAYPEDIKFVTEFAKKTGDYPSLSATDIQVIALTYRYEKEKVGTEHLKQAPEKKKEILDSNINPPDDQAKDLPGFYLPEGDEDEEESDTEEVSDNKNSNENEEQSVNKNNYRDEEDNCRALSKCSNLASVDSQCLKTANDISVENDTESDYDTALSEEEHCDVQDLNKKFEKLNCDPTELKVECGNDLTIDDILKPVKNDDDSEGNKQSKEDKEGEEDKEDEEDEKDTEDEEDEEDEEESEDDDEGWITPSNFLSKKKEMESGVFKEKAATVACLTTDYAMQNVLLQIGLNIVSLDGKVIKEMRTFILRCYACFKTTGIVTKLFCPSCGNKTLKKVAISVDDEGNQHLYINYKKPLTSRGKKYSLPTYQGGKHACNPILFEDQPIPDQRPTKLGRAKNDPMNEDFIAGYSPFVMRDVNSRAAMLGIRSNNGPVKHWMKRNPNEVRKHRK